MRNYQIGLYEKAIPEQFSIPEMLTISKEAGYDFFEISIDRTDKRINRLFDNRFQDIIRYAMMDANITIGSMCLSALGTYTLGNEDPQVVNTAIEIIKGAIDFAEKTGIRIVQIPACDVPKNGNHTRETDQRFIDNLRLAVDYASAKAVTIGLENMEDSYMDSVAKCMRLIRGINSPYFQLYSDAGNITSAARINNADPNSDFLQGKDHYYAFHLKETRPNKYGGLFYGEGHVDFPGLVKEAWYMGIRRYVLEYWYTGNENWREDLSVARQLCEKWIKQSNTEGNIT